MYRTLFLTVRGCFTETGLIYDLRKTFIKFTLFNIMFGKISRCIVCALFVVDQQIRLCLLTFRLSLTTTDTLLDDSMVQR